MSIALLLLASTQELESRLDSQRIPLLILDDETLDASLLRLEQYSGVRLLRAADLWDERDPEEPVRVRLHDVTLRTALQVILEPRAIDVLVDDDGVWIVPRGANGPMETRRFPVEHLAPEPDRHRPWEMEDQGGLFERDAGDGIGYDASTIEDVVRQFTGGGEDGWGESEDHGACITAIEDVTGRTRTLIVTQTPEVLSEIDRLLAAMERFIPRRVDVEVLWVRTDAVVSNLVSPSELDAVVAGAAVIRRTAVSCFNSAWNWSQAIVGSEETGDWLVAEVRPILYPQGRTQVLARIEAGAANLEVQTLVPDNHAAAIRLPNPGEWVLIRPTVGAGVERSTDAAIDELPPQDEGILTTLRETAFGLTGQYTLVELGDLIGTQTGINTVIDPRLESRYGIDPDSMVIDIEDNEWTVEQVLRLNLPGQDLTFDARDGILWIRHELDVPVHGVVYDLLPPTGVTRWSGVAAACEVMQCVELIETTHGPEGWQSGKWDIAMDEGAVLLFARTTDETHAGIREVHRTLMTDRDEFVRVRVQTAEIGADDARRLMREAGGSTVVAESLLPDGGGSWTATLQESSAASFAADDSTTHLGLGELDPHGRVWIDLELRRAHGGDEEVDRARVPLAPGEAVFFLRRLPGDEERWELNAVRRPG